MRNVGGVLAGLVLAAGLVIGTNLLLVRVTGPTAAWFLAVTLVGAVVYHLAAGFVCAAIAQDARAATWSLVLLGTALLLSSVVQTWQQMPGWYSLAMVAIVPTSLKVGAAVHSHRQSATAGAAASHAVVR